MSEHVARLRSPLQVATPKCSALGIGLLVM